MRDAVLLGVGCALQGLTSNYLLVFTAVAAGRGDRGPGRRVAAPGAGAHDRAPRAGGGRCGRAAWRRFSIPYYLTQREQGLTRSLDEVARYSSTWRDYLSTAGRLHYAAWSHRFLEGSTALFPGVVALALAVVGAGRHARPDATPRVRMAAAIGAAGVALSFGPALPGYATLYRWLPLLQGVRGAARFGFLALIAVAVLAGFGVAALRARCGGAPLVAGARRRPHRGRERGGAARADRLQAVRRHPAHLPVARATRRSAPSRSSRSSRRRPSSATRRTC